MNVKTNQLERELAKLKKNKKGSDDLDDNIKQFLLKHQGSNASWKWFDTKNKAIEASSSK